MKPLVSFDRVTYSYSPTRGWNVRFPVLAVNAVSFGLFSGETLGVVGESGCGKSTVGRIAVGLLEPQDGSVFVGSQKMYGSVGADQERRQVQRLGQMIFQDPFSSLNPRMKIWDSVSEPLRCSGGKNSRKELRSTALSMLEEVGIRPELADGFPHEFSGGQRQRIAVARALVMKPRFIVCDEPTSSLDASVQAQVLNLLCDMQRRYGLSYLFISHDLSVVRHMSDRVLVMYRGQIMEEAPTEALFKAPCHPYTRLLFASMPDIFWDRLALGSKATREIWQQRNETERGGIPTTSCGYAVCCPFAEEFCWREAVVPQTIERGHTVRCWKMSKSKMGTAVA